MFFPVVAGIDQLKSGLRRDGQGRMDGPRQEGRWGIRHDARDQFAKVDRVHDGGGDGWCTM
jgi:hypothetical protein